MSWQAGSVVAVSRRNGIAWDSVVSCEMIGIYRPHALACQAAACWLNLPPQSILMVACHNIDVNAAQDAGMRTAFVRWPDAWGPAGPPDPIPNKADDCIGDGFQGLHDRVLATL